MKNITLDSTDIELLRHLQENSKTSNAELARRVSLSAPAVHARIRRLEDDGVITGYSITVDREALDYDMLCFIQVTLQSHNRQIIDEFKQKIMTFDEVLECHQLIGTVDYLLKVVIRNNDDLRNFLMDKLSAIDGISRFTTSVALTEIKSTTVLPIPDDIEGQDKHGK